MKLVKLENGNVLLYDDNNDLIRSMRPDVYLEASENLVIVNLEDHIVKLYPQDITELEVKPNAATAFSGDAFQLLEILSSDFFFLDSDGGGGGNTTPVGQILYMRLNSSQNLNVVTPFTDLDFVEVSNTIPGATVSSNFPIGPETYKGVVTLPAGKYKTSYRINCENGTNTQKVIVTNISRYAPSVIYYAESTTYEMFRNRTFASIVNSDANYEFLNLSQTESFGIISARTTAAGNCDSVPEQSFWKIEKIG